MHLEAALLLALLPALCLSTKSCTTAADCIKTQCAGGSKALCKHPDGAGFTLADGVCACKDTTNRDSHRNMKERIVGSKHGHKLYQNHLLPSRTEINRARKQWKNTFPTKRRGYMNPTMTDAFSTMKNMRTRRSTYGPDVYAAFCDTDHYIELHRLCDGIYDCTTKEDEDNCENRACPMLSFRCNTRPSPCYDIMKRCDGVSNCRDNSDESNCDTATCPGHFFRCDSGQCIFYVYECDGVPHCSDRSDESNCQDFNRNCNVTGGDYLCPNGDCIKRDLQCDEFLRIYYYHYDFFNSDLKECDVKKEMSCPGHECYHPDYAQCNSGRCIHRLEWCNMIEDCIDGSDETSCYNHTCPADPTNQYYRYFQCKTGHCIDWWSWCNIKIDCPDKSDENSCQNNKCENPDYEFQCESGHCISSVKRCDNRFDCPDRSDESNCSEHYTVCPMFNYRCTPDKCYPVAQHHEHCTEPEEYACYERANNDEKCFLECMDGFVRCEDQSQNKQCVLYEFRCNGVSDCVGGIDENCYSECPNDYYRCRNGQCLGHMFICEYMYSYEYARYLISKHRVNGQNSYDFVKQRCPRVFNKITCDNYTCVDQRAFQCDSGHCIEERSRCDIKLDCLDGSDEMNCFSENTSCSPAFYSRCRSGQCFAPYFQCDGSQYCPDNSDENNCLNATCPDNFFRCSSGQCVPYYIRCNGYPDCRDNSDEQKCPDMYCPENYYKCADGRCVSRTFICDAQYWNTKGHRVCSDAFSFVSCENYTCIDSGYTRCKNGRCILKILINKCDGRSDCTDASDEDDCLFECTNGDKVLDTTKCPCSANEYECLAGVCINLMVVCKGYFVKDPYFKLYNEHCPLHQDDERYCPFLKCPSNYLRMPTGDCAPAGLVRSNITCSMSTAPNRCLNSCPNDQYYIQCCNCQCIHRVSICDGIPDCPDKADEQHCGVPDCRADQFYCGATNCFPSQLRCDGHVHCPNEEDETNCKLNESKIVSEKATTLVKHDTVQSIDLDDSCSNPSICFTAQQICNLTDWQDCTHETGNRGCFLLCDKPCTCINVGIIQCNEWNENMTLESDLNVLWPFNTSSPVFIKDGKFPLRERDQRMFTFETMSEITITNASLKKVPTRLLSCAFNIHHLDLSKNAITYINVGDFGHLYRLSVLDLSNNLIASIEDFSFKGIRVRLLNIQNNMISGYGTDLFSGIAADGTVYVDEYNFCCLLPEYFPQQNCFSKTDKFSSCKDLMKNAALGAMLWIVGLLALIGNVGILIYKIFVDKEKLKNYGVMVINLALADTLMAVYLLSIASVDVMYRGIYVTKEREWRNSIGCSVLGVLCTLSSEASVLFICLITLDRYLISKYPFRQVRITSYMLIIICISIWITAATIALTPFMITSYFNGKYYSTSGVCNALPLTKESFDGWEFSFAINVCLNCILFLFVGVGQFLIYNEVTASQAQSLVSTRRNNDMKMARRLTYIVISDFFCWVPIGVLGILAMRGIDISPDAYAWVTVFVLPVNSALNPFLYTLLSLFSDCTKNCPSLTRRALQESAVTSGRTLSRSNT